MSDQSRKPRAGTFPYTAACAAAAVILLLFITAGCSSAPGQETQDTPASGHMEAAKEGVEGNPSETYAPLYEEGELTAETTEFEEIWAYLIDGRENTLDPRMPITDIGYFGAEIDTYGKLTAVPNASKLDSYKGRVHMVVVCSSRALTHFILLPDSDTRAALIKDLIAAAEPYDGLQIDFELVPAKDGNAFFSFLKELSDAMRSRNKLFTVALPARTRTLENDVYDYARITPIVDRVFVMAYDEHWSTSKPGSIASLGWCARIAKHSIETVGSEKLVMGLPFYGRTWGDVNTFRAFFFSGINRIMEEQKIERVSRDNEIPTFTYQIPVTVTVYFEDVHSLSVRLKQYQDMGVRRTGFWCLGQEDPRIWDMISLRNSND